MRLFAQPGDKLYSRLSVNAQMWAKITHCMKVGRNNFNPPPAVESNVVRIEPKNPRPQISYEEWDGLLRIVFNRKNKTMRANFMGTTVVLDMLERNYRLWCSQNDVAVDDTPLGEAEIANGVGSAVDADVDMADEEEVFNGFSDGDIDEDDLPDFFKQERDARKVKGANRKKRGRVHELVREKVRKVLEDETQLADKRAQKCDEGDFLRMLYAFNQEGIHFS
jgi:18S rRNA (adenine1779-N6/adenine1780-N6)-dimethyltransferase